MLSLDFYEHLPKSIKFSNIQYYTLEDWEKHFRNILGCSLEFKEYEYQEIYYNYYIEILKCMIHKDYEIYISRFIVVSNNG
ncbi:hypothetical protein [Klebsiella phage phiKp_21]|nr:hypothetical protein [Klebsiella phage phiKp_21]